MPSLVVNFPDCSSIEDATGRDGTVSVTAHCAPPGPPPVFGAWEIAAFIIVALAALITVGMVRYNAHDNKPHLQELKNEARKQELDAQVAMAKAHKHCLTCGTDYDPELT